MKNKEEDHFTILEFGDIYSYFINIESSWFDLKYHFYTLYSYTKYKYLIDFLKYIIKRIRYVIHIY